MADEFYGKGIKIASGFDLSAKSPLDNRTVVNTIAERDAHIIGNRVYEGMRVYVKETKRDYLFDGSTWVEDVANSGGGATEVFMGDTEPEEETILLWVDTSENENMANEGLSGEIEKSISNLSKRVKALEENDLLVFQDELHSHANKSVLDGITTSDIWNWNHPNIRGFSGDYNDLKNKPTIPTKVSELTNDKGYLTEYQDVYWDAIIGKPTTFEPSSHNHSINDISDYPNDLATKDYVEKAIDNAKLESGNTQVDLSAYAKKTDLHEHSNKSVLDNITTSKVNQWDSKSNFDGNYNNLKNKPTIPNKVSQLQNDSGYLTSHQDISHKVDKVNGKSLISDSEIERLSTLKNYDDSNIRSQLNDIENEIDELKEGNIDIDLTNYVTKSELSSKADKTELHSHTNKSVLDGITTNKITEWNNKSTFDGNYNSLTNKPASLPANGGNANTVGGYSLWVGTQAQYDAIATKSNTTIYMIKEG